MKKDNQSDAIKQALKNALSDSGSGGDGILEKVLGVLDNQRLLRYSTNNSISLLSTQGKVLVALLESPKITIRGIAVYLCLSETMVMKVIKSLITEGLITKTKDKRQNIYKINYFLLKNHPDIHHLSGAIQEILGYTLPIKIEEDEPF